MSKALKYCGACVASHIRLKDVLVPLVSCNDHKKEDLWNMIGGEALGRLFAEEMTVIAKSEKTPYYPNVEVFKMAGIAC